MKLMSKNQNALLSKPEIKFWLVILGLAVSGAVAFADLKAEVAAVYDKEIKLREDYEVTAEVLQDVRDSQIRMEKDIQFIYKELGGNQNE